MSISVATQPVQALRTIFRCGQGKRSAPPPLGTPPAKAAQAAAEVLARHGMTITEGITAFLEETAYQGKPAVTASKEARMHAELLKFNALMKHKYGSKQLPGMRRGKK